MLQSAAIPYRVDDTGELSILLVRSRTRRRWILPKGKIGSRLLASRSAEREAFEEAGVLGRIDPIPVGSYKQQTAGPVETVTVQAYALEVIDELESWPEMDQRERRWFTVKQALRAVRDPEIRKVIRTFRRHKRMHPDTA